MEYKNTDNWNPILKASTSSDEYVKGREYRQFKLHLKADDGEAQNRKMFYQKNQYEACGLIWERCVKNMKTNIEALKDFKDSIYKNLVEFPKEIKQHALNYQELRYEMSVILDGFTKCFGKRQKDQESLQDYTRRFEKSYEVLQLHIGGQIQIQKYVKTLNGLTDYPYNEDEFLTNEQLTKQASEQLASFVYLQNADQLKYGSIL